LDSAFQVLRNGGELFQGGFKIGCDFRVFVFSWLHLLLFFTAAS